MKIIPIEKEPPNHVKRYYFESNRSLLYEIRDLAVGGRQYASNIMSNNQDSDFFHAMFCVFERNADSLLKLFDALELLPDIENLSERRSS